MFPAGRRNVFRKGIFQTYRAYVIENALEKLMEEE